MAGIQNQPAANPQQPYQTLLGPLQQAVQPLQQPAAAPIPRDQVAVTPQATQQAAMGPQVPAAYPPPQAAPQQAAPPINVQPNADDHMVWMVKQQLMSPNVIEVNNGLYAAIPMAATHRMEVIQMVMDKLRSTSEDTTRYACLDVLQKLNAKEAVQALEAWTYSGIPGPIHNVASQTLTALGGGAQVLPPAQQTQGATQAAPPVNQATMNARDNDLAARLLQGDGQSKIAAAMEIAKLPAADQMAIFDRVIDNPALLREPASLLVAALKNHVREPGVADRLAHVMDMQNLFSFRDAANQAVCALAALNSPRYAPSIAKYLAHPQMSWDVKRAVIDNLAKNPQMVNEPTIIVALSACLHMHEIDPLAKAASHALSLARSPRARDALAHSPLLKESSKDLVLRGLWDLGHQPKPYPPDCVEQLKKLAANRDAQIAAEAKKLLK